MAILYLFCGVLKRTLAGDLVIEKERFIWDVGDRLIKLLEDDPILVPSFLSGVDIEAVSDACANGSFSFLISVILS